MLQVGDAVQVRPNTGSAELLDGIEGQGVVGQVRSDGTLDVLYAEAGMRACALPAEDFEPTALH